MTYKELAELILNSMNEEQLQLKIEPCVHVRVKEESC